MTYATTETHDDLTVKLQLLADRYTYDKTKHLRLTTMRRSFGEENALSLLPISVKAWPLDYSYVGDVFWMTRRGRLGVVFSNTPDRLRIITRKIYFMVSGEQFLGLHKRVDELLG